MRGTTLYLPGNNLMSLHFKDFLAIEANHIFNKYSSRLKIQRDRAFATAGPQLWNSLSTMQV